MTKFWRQGLPWSSLGGIVQMDNKLPIMQASASEYRGGCACSSQWHHQRSVLPLLSNYLHQRRSYGETAVYSEDVRYHRHDNFSDVKKGARRRQFEIFTRATEGLIWAYLCPRSVQPELLPFDTLGRYGAIRQKIGALKGEARQRRECSPNT